MHTAQEWAFSSGTHLDTGTGATRREGDQLSVQGRCQGTGMGQPQGIVKHAAGMHHAVAAGTGVSVCVGCAAGMGAWVCVGDGCVGVHWLYNRDGWVWGCALVVQQG